MRRSLLHSGNFFVDRFFFGRFPCLNGPIVLLLPLLQARPSHVKAPANSDHARPLVGELGVGHGRIDAIIDGRTCFAERCRFIKTHTKQSSTPGGWDIGLGVEGGDAGTAKTDGHVRKSTRLRLRVGTWTLGAQARVETKPPRRSKRLCRNRRKIVRKNVATAILAKFFLAWRLLRHRGRAEFGQGVPLTRKRRAHAFGSNSL